MEAEKFSVQASIIVGACIIALAIVISGGGSVKNIAPQAQVATAPQKIEVPPVTDADHIRGPRNPKVMIVEYSDMECPFCKRFHETVKQVVGQYGDKVAWVYRHFPIDQLHPKARKEAEATECAAHLGGEEIFWKYIDKIFEITPANNKLEESELYRVAREFGLDETKFKECLTSGKFASKVEEHIQSGIKAGAKGTPYSLLVYGKGVVQVKGGAASFESLKSQIDALLAEVK